MAQRLTLALPAPAARVARPERRRLCAITLGVVVLHGATLLVLRDSLQPPSLLAHMAEPLYTRTIHVQTPTAPPAAAQPLAESAPIRPEARIHKAPPAIKKEVKKPAPAPQPDHAEAAAPPSPAASQALAAATPTEAAPTAAAPATAASAPAAGPRAGPAPAVEPGTDTPLAGLATADAPTASASDAVAAEPTPWPGNTRLSYRLSGNYRGELHGSAQVLWQHDDERYQAVVQLDAGLLLSSRFTSQGAITPHGLHPEVYEEQVRKRRRGVQLEPDTIRLNKGERVPRPDAVQDAASQFVDIGQRLRTGQIAPTAGTQLRVWLARPGGVDEWTYDIVGEETVHLPRLGAVAALHLKPRPLDKPRGPIHAEIWYAPSLQYLPVRIRISQEPDTYMDLLVDTIEQQ